MNYIIKCEQILDCHEELKITAPAKSDYQVFSVSRQKRASSNNPSKIFIFLQDIITSGEHVDRKCIASLETTEEKKIICFPISQQAIILSKEGGDPIQIIFASSSKINLNIEKINQQIIIIPKTNLSMFIMELRRASKSDNPFQVIGFILQHFFPEPFFDQVHKNPNLDQAFGSELRSFLIICINRIESDVVFEFKKFIDFVDFQLDLGYELSLGSGYFLLFFLNYFSDFSQICSKLISTNHNFITFLNLFSFLDDKSVFETLMCSPAPQNCRICDENLSFLFDRILRLDIKYHYSYHIFFMEKMTSSSSEIMKLLLNSDKIIDREILFHYYNHQKLLENVEKTDISVSPSVGIECVLSPFVEKLKEEMRDRLKVEEIEEFEQNEENNLEIEKVCDIKTRLNREKKLVINKYSGKLNIRPNDVLIGSSYIYISVLLLCILVSSVMLWKFSLI